MFKEISIYIQEHFGLTLEIQEKILDSLLIIVLLWLVRFLILHLVRKRTEDVRIRYMWRKTTFYIALLFGLLAIGRIWTMGFKSISTYLGLVSAGLAIALKDLIASIAGWIYMITKKPVAIGDRIEIGEYRGDVIDIRLFKFTLMEIGNWVDADQSTGRVIHLPNQVILTETLANYSKGFEYIWDELPVLVTFESDWEKAKEILMHIAEKFSAVHGEAAKEKVLKASHKFMIHYTKLTPTVYTSVKDSGIMLTMRYLCEPRKRRGQAQTIWEEILRSFAGEERIDFAYPTQRLYNNLTEGKVK